MASIYKSSALCTALFSILLLTACGGGNSEPPSSEPHESTDLPTIVKTQGFYEGTISNGNVYNAFVLNDGRIFTFYAKPSTDAPGEFDVDGFLQGQVTSALISDTGNSFTASMKDYSIPGVATPGTLSATYKSGSGFDGKIAGPDGAVLGTFTGKTANVAGYNFHSPAALTDISGSWSISNVESGLISTVGGTLRVGADGAISGTLNDSCVFSGTLKPHSDVNIFDMTVQFDSGASCKLSGQSATGIVVSVKDDNGEPVFIAIGTDTKQTQGLLIVGERSVG